jgi:glycosyltransferase involved in cell wall biosynthesis
MTENDLNIFKLDIFRKSNRIAIIGQKGIPAEFVGTSGVEFYVEYRAKRLVSDGKIVDCYVRNWATPKTQTNYQGINLIHLPTINTKHLDAVIHSFLASIYTCLTPTDTVWYQASGPAMFSFIPKLFGKKIVVTIHTLEWKRVKWRWSARFILKLGEWVGVESADLLISVSKDLADYLDAKYNHESVVDPPVVEKVKYIKPNIITQKYGLKGNDFILYFGRFVPEKRIEWLINAYQQLKPKDIKLVLAGGPSHTDKYYLKLQKLCYGDKNIIFTGYLFGAEKIELISNCGLFVLPSKVEGSPIVIQEIMQFKKYTIVPDLLKNEEINYNPYLVYFNQNLEEDLINKIKLVCRNIFKHR